MNKTEPLHYNDGELDRLSKLYEQAVTDPRQAVSEAEEAYMSMFGVDAGLAALERHWQKMINRGYLQLQKQKPAQAVAEERAEYKNSREVKRP